MKRNADLSSCKSWTQAFSVGVRNFSSPHCGNVEMHKSVNASSRNPTDLRIIQQPVRQLSSLQNVTKVDGSVCNSPRKLCSMDFVAARCYSLSEVQKCCWWHLGDLCKTCKKVCGNFHAKIHVWTKSLTCCLNKTVHERFITVGPYRALPTLLWHSQMVSIWSTSPCPTG